MGEAYAHKAKVATKKKKEIMRVENIVKMVGWVCERIKVRLLKGWKNWYVVLGMLLKICPSFYTMRSPVSQPKPFVVSFESSA